MMDNAWCSIEKVPYYFLKSSMKFQGHAGWKIDDLDENLNNITRPVAAIKSLRFALFFFFNLQQRNTIDAHISPDQCHMCFIIIYVSYHCPAAPHGVHPFGQYWNDGLSHFCQAITWINANLMLIAP